MKPQYKRFLEGHANPLRAKCAVLPFGRLDPFELARRMGMRILVLDPSTGVPADICERLLIADSQSWSAGTLHLPDGSKLVVMNPTHRIERQRASLMEEIAHIHLGHRPTQLIHMNAIVLRSWDDSAEK